MTGGYLSALQAKLESNPRDYVHSIFKIWSTPDFNFPLAKFQIWSTPDFHFLQTKLQNLEYSRFQFFSKFQIWSTPDFHFWNKVAKSGVLQILIFQSKVAKSGVLWPYEPLCVIFFIINQNYPDNRDIYYVIFTHNFFNISSVSCCQKVKRQNHRLERCLNVNFWVCKILENKSKIR